MVDDKRGGATVRHSVMMLFNVKANADSRHYGLTPMS